MNSSRDQLSKHTSDYTREDGADLAEVAGVWTAQFVATPTTATMFKVGPTAFRFTSATTAGWDSAGYYSVAVGASVSAAASAFSAAINLAKNFDNNYQYSVSTGATAATAAGAITDITVTAAVPGNYVDVVSLNVSTSKVIFSNNTATRTGKILPEGFTSYTTSAGSVIKVSDPAEATRMQVNYPRTV